ncbi:uncharacterized protein N0V89_004029 [Didymosphaeria variabile]|uniref:Quino amine dehydrogenase beta chain protein n=1 Tax=Didymosphaeria variabile TaxID=1932322 RepID=A0A9W9CCV9_9PLEO|nr:uncharacterized protein N0V89_004029 [Didymosphaeria variabile]KAJ4356003.1 hypothetical protein N0V89_004029 [Didymosphaeria variabile]
MHSLDTLAILALLLTTSLAQQTRTVFQFPKPTWLENIATTRTGHLLTGVLNKAPAELHIVDPFGTYEASSANATLLHSFPGVNTVFGISEYAPDLFAVATGDYSPSTGATKGTYAVWTVDISRPDDTKVHKIADLPNIEVINGLAALNKDAILLADSFAGTVVRLDVKTGRSHTVINDGSTAFAAPLGVNGLKVLHATNPPTLYYTNSGLNATFSAPIHPTTGKLDGNVSMLASNESVPDDLAVTDDETMFFAKPYAGTLTRAKAGEKAVVVAGSVGSLELGGVTSATLGRSYKDRGVVYVATMGGFNADGSYAEGGKIVAVEVGN